MFSLVVSSLGDPETEKCINDLVKMLDKGVTTLKDFNDLYNEKYSKVRISENPEKFREMLNELK